MVELQGTPDLSQWINPSIGAAAGNGNIVDIPQSGNVVYSLTATIAGTEDQTTPNTATIDPPTATFDTNTSNNSDNDEDAIGLFIDSFESLDNE